MKGAMAAERPEEKDMDLQYPSPASPTSLASVPAPRSSYGTSKASTLHTYDSDSDDNSEVALAMSAASAGASSSRALEPHRNPVPGFSDEAESRLEQAAAGLNLRAEEEAGEDEIRDNQHRQEDELMALEAIYGDDLSVFENKGGLRYFQIYIRYNLNDGVEVCTKLSSANGNP